MNKYLNFFAVILLSALLFTAAACQSASRTAKKQKLPVILDTDIGDDIDDHWALAMLLRCPELDIRLITTATGDTTYRAKLVAKMLLLARRTDIPIGIGPARPGYASKLEDWVKEIDLNQYPGKINPDGAQAIADTILQSKQPVTLIAIGPLTTVAEALRRQPRITKHSQFIGMQGSVRRGYDGSPNIHPEYNVKRELAAAQTVFSSDWNMTITPLDTCDQVRLDGGLFQEIYTSEDPLLKELMNVYKLWLIQNNNYRPNFDGTKSSTILFDTVAIYLALNTDFVQMETVPLVVDNEGLTRTDPNGKPVNCALEWKDLPAYESFLTSRLLGKQ